MNEFYIVYLFVLHVFDALNDGVMVVPILFSSHRDVSYVINYDMAKSIEGMYECVHIMYSC